MGLKDTSALHNSYEPLYSSYIAERSKVNWTRSKSCDQNFLPTLFQINCYAISGDTSASTEARIKAILQGGTFCIINLAVS